MCAQLIIPCILYVVKSSRPLVQEDQIVVQEVMKYCADSVEEIIISKFALYLLIVSVIIVYMYILRPKWINFIGVKYSLNEFVIMGWEMNDLPVFGEIVEIVCIPYNAFLRLRKCLTIGIVRHYHSFSVKKTNDERLVLLQNIKDHQIYQGHDCVRKPNYLYILVRSLVEKQI